MTDQIVMRRQLGSMLGAYKRGRDSLLVGSYLLVGCLENLTGLCGNIGSLWPLQCGQMLALSSTIMY